MTLCPRVMCDSLRRLLKEFLEDSYVEVDTELEVNLPVALENLNFFFQPLVSCLDASEKKLFDEFQEFSP